MVLAQHVLLGDATLPPATFFSSTLDAHTVGARQGGELTDLVVD